jgi:phosphoglycerate dehydrogenase-like enzyme
MSTKPRLLINLLPGFFNCEALKTVMNRLAERFDITTASCNTPDEIQPLLSNADAVLMWSWPKLDDALLDACPRLKFAAHLDVSQAAAKVAIRRKLPVSLSRSAFSPAVAELALALTLNLLRKVSDHHMQMRYSTETWVNDFPGDIDPLERQLTGRRVGIVGFGKIGRRLRELLAPFACDVAICDPFVSSDIAKQANVTSMSLDELLKRSQIVVLSAASNDGSKHLLDADRIALMPKHAILINTARAAPVDTDALVERLKQNTLSAAIDVFDLEPLAKDHPLRTLPNAYLTPHRGGGLMESVVRLVGWLADDLIAHLDGKPQKYPLVESMIASLDA